MASKRILHQMPQHALQAVVVSAGGHDPGSHHVQAAIPRPRWCAAASNALTAWAVGPHRTPRAATGFVAPSRSCSIICRIFSSELSTGQQHVLLELWVVVQPLRILEHQRQLRHDVLEVVHHEGRHAVEGVELARLEQAPRWRASAPGNRPPGARPSSAGRAPPSSGPAAPAAGPAPRSPSGRRPRSAAHQPRPPAGPSSQAGSATASA